MDESSKNLIFPLILMIVILIALVIENIILHKQNAKLKVSVMILSYSLDLYNTLYGVIEKKDFEKANLIITQARRKEEISGRNSE